MQMRNDGEKWTGRRRIACLKEDIYQKPLVERFESHTLPRERRFERGSPLEVNNNRFKRIPLEAMRRIGWLPTSLKGNRSTGSNPAVLLCSSFEWLFLTGLSMGNGR
jgi:hypothetical protein